VTGKRRVSETVTVLRHPTGWISNLGHDDRQVCQTVHDYAAAGDLDGFRAFHAEHVVIWKTETRRGRTGSARHYCDAHLPDEFRPKAGDQL